MGSSALSGEGVWPGFVVANPASPLGPLSHERPRHLRSFKFKSDETVNLSTSELNFIFASNHVSSKNGCFFWELHKEGFSGLRNSPKKTPVFGPN